MDQSFLCEKEGRHKRFTLRQLQAMGRNETLNNYNGWKIIEEPKTPEELLPKIKGPEITIPKKVEPKSKAAKSKSQQTENKDEHSGETETGAEGSGADASGEAGEDSSQSSQGDSKAE